MDIWIIVGIGLLVWLFFDVKNGKTWIHREILKENEPVKYWLVILIWFLVAISIIFSEFY